ncbi:hypothetical protein N7451_004773 [Penicillium sp. IBT 35674x]|nr:hypothetical protein N7451_004773 [Penicillium sp. IBT 35674x]
MAEGRPKGRPKVQVDPCRFCKKQFKRIEHLKRHERIRPWPLHYLALVVPHRDLLSRHERLCHSPTSVEEPVEPTDAPDVQIREDLEHLISHPHVSFESSATFHENSMGSQIPDLVSPEATYLPCVTSPVEDLHDHMAQSFTALNEPDVWNNEVFSFNNVIPSHFFDTDISLCDLFQQFAPGQPPASHAGHTTQIGPLNQPQTPLSTTPQQTATKTPPLPPRFPSTDDQLHHNNLDVGSEAAGCPWILSASAYKHILDTVAERKSVLFDFKLPSRFTLMRYLEGYFCGFHDHLPFLHPATFDPQSTEPELLLALAAVGALYRFEPAKSHQLYDAARCLLDRSFYNRRQQTMAAMKVHSPVHTEIRGVLDSSSKRVSQPLYGTHTDNTSLDDLGGESTECLQRVQTLIVLMALSAWGEPALAKDSLSMGSQLAVLVRELGIGQPDNTTNVDMSWRAWAMRQQRRRTLLVAYILFNLHTITFNVPPLILSQEVALCLPSCEAEWKQNSSAEWERYRQISGCREHVFTTTLDRLLHGRNVSENGAVSSFSNYVLIHGLVQKIYLEHQSASCLPHDVSPMRPELLKSMEKALKSWQSSWEATYESTLDPRSPKGPLGFNATALLRLAHIRLNANVALCHDLISGNPTQIQQIFSAPNLRCLSRSPSLDRAILQCIHALSIPVRVGIPYVARTQTLHWDIQHSICSLECVFLLTRWMQDIAKDVGTRGLAALREDEHKLLAMVTSLIQETELQDTLEYEEDNATRINRLAASTARLWAEVSSGIHVFDLAHRIGASLSIIADMLESQVPPPGYNS